MFSYPLTFDSSSEHIAHIKNNQKFYRDVLDLKDTSEELELQKKKNAEMNALIEQLTERVKKFDDENKQKDEELMKTKEMLKDRAALEELAGKKKEGDSVVHKGACDEKYVEIVLKELVGDVYTVDNGDQINKMDVRLVRNDGAFTIGIECKDKEKVSKADIEKFKRDKVKNKFKRSIFISTHQIKNILEEENQVKIDGDEMWIVTKDHIFLAAVMKLYLANLEYEIDNVFDKKIMFDKIIDTYNTWQYIKKGNEKLDKKFLGLMELTPDFERNIKGHIYHGVQGKFIAGRTPY